MGKWEKRAFVALTTFVIVVALAMIAYAAGYLVGAWPMTCKIAHTQPKCIEQGWNGGTQHVKLERNGMGSGLGPE